MTTSDSMHPEPKSLANMKLDLKYYMFDWDDNILHMPTRIHLERKTESGWEPYDVSTAEFARIRRDTVNYRPKEGDWDKAFVDFYDVGEKGEDVFLEDTKAALAPVIAGEKSGAPSFEPFKKALIEGRLFAIITARSHSSRGIRKGVEYFIYNVLSDAERRQMVACLKEYITRFDGRVPNLSDEDIISNYLNLNRYHGVTSPEFEKKMGRKSAGSESPEHAKMLAIKDFVQHVIALIKGVGVREPISIGFSDDDRKNVEAVEEYIQDELKKEFPHIKFVVYDTSDPSRPNGQKIVIEDSRNPS
ncbi:MAG TPA: hypothetical protein PJ991_05925 [Kiritimatiellia bacterium]|nr:hypothetical protein [Kiritimatiellia bacterium]